MRIFTHKMTSSGKSKIGIRIPIALHFYASFTFIILLSSIFSFVTYNSVVSSYIESECTKRINTAVNSCASFANAFSTSSIIDENDSPEEVRATLLNSILTSTDISIDASMILLSTDNISAGFFSASEDSYQIVWPVSNYTTSSIVQSKDVLDIILLQNGLSTDKTVKAVNIDGNMYYYRFAKIEYHTGNSQHFNDYDDYYLLFYVDSSFYDDFVQSMNTALMSAMIMSIVVAGFISIIVSFPIIHTARKLSRFASQISKGDFRMIKGHMASGELSDLSEAMNHMANKLEKNDQEQKTFFQNASHELRTPLMSIQGYAEGIKYGVFDNEKTEEAVDIIISETTRLSSM
ncbi:MAG TPA: HAMP domain-containing sensor histidine kinase, partial [Saccharofermentans sp.]|nr:HAMP domain-containing sensor histidine kinase [Saccharofermentans sp.]